SRLRMKSCYKVRLSLTFSELGYPTDLVGSRGNAVLLSRALRRGRDAPKICRIVGASGSVPLRHLAVRTKRPRTIDGAIGHVRRDDLVGRLSFLDPLFHRRDFVERVGARPSGAMPHSRDHIELNRFPFGALAGGLRGALDVIHGV